MQNTSRFKHSPTGAALLLLMLSLHAHASPKKENAAAKTRLTVPSKAGDLQKNRNLRPVGERFRLWFSINPTDCNDPVLQGNAGKDDHEFDGYGELRINNVLEWKVVRQNAINFRIKHLNLPSSSQVDPRRQGYSLNSDPTIFMDKHEIKFSTATGRIAHISLRLMDKDDPQMPDYKPSEQNNVDRHDDLIGNYKIDLDLGKLGTSDGRYYWFWSSKDDNGNAVGTNLYLFAEHVGTVYESGSNGLPKPGVDPKIADKKFPGKIPVPGPVVTKPVPRAAKSSSR